MNRKGRPGAKVKVTIVGRPGEAALEAVAAWLLQINEAQPALRLVKTEKVEHAAL